MLASETYVHLENTHNAFSTDFTVIEYCTLDVGRLEGLPTIWICVWTRYWSILLISNPPQRTRRVRFDTRNVMKDGPYSSLRMSIGSSLMKAHPHLLSARNRPLRTSACMSYCMLAFVLRSRNVGGRKNVSAGPLLFDLGSNVTSRGNVNVKGQE